MIALIKLYANAKNVLGNINQRDKNIKKNSTKLCTSKPYKRKNDIDILSSRIYTATRERVRDPEHGST